MRHNAVSSQDRGRHLHEQLALIARITRNRNAWVLEIRIQVVRETLRSAADGIDVHAIRASAKRAAQTRRTEGQILEECVYRRRIVARIGRLLHFGQLSRKLLVGHIGNPTLQFSTHIAIFHFVSPNRPKASFARKGKSFGRADVRFR